MKQESKLFPGWFVEVPPVLQDPHLVVTADNVIWATDNKAVGLLPLHPLEHLELTTDSEKHLAQLIGRDPDHKGKKIPLSDYNAWTVAGESIVMPFLRVMRDTGQVVGHEGRHRAAALYREDPKALLWVAIELIDETGHAVYYEEPRHSRNPRSQRRYLDASDVPPIFYGQFRKIYVDIVADDLWPIHRD